MAAIIAERGRIYFTATGDTHASLANKEIMCVTFNPGGAGDTFDLSVGSDVIVEGTSVTGDSLIIPAFGCINITGTITYTCDGSSTCIVYVK